MLRLFSVCLVSILVLPALVFAYGDCPKDEPPQQMQVVGKIVSIEPRTTDKKVCDFKPQFTYVSSHSLCPWNDPTEGLVLTAPKEKGKCPEVGREFSGVLMRDKKGKLIEEITIHRAPAQSKASGDCPMCEAVTKACPSCEMVRKLAPAAKAFRGVSKPTQVPEGAGTPVPGRAGPAQSQTAK